jgi:hypothetical protein
VTTIVIIVDGNTLVGLSNATEATSPYERKTIAIIMAAMDAVGNALGSGKEMADLRRLIAPTIKQRKAEAGSA